MLQSVLLLIHPYSASPPWQAELAGRDFTADKAQVIVVSTGAAVEHLDSERMEEERKEAEDRHRHRSVHCHCTNELPFLVSTIILKLYLNTPSCCLAHSCRHSTPQTTHTPAMLSLCRLRIPRRPQWTSTMTAEQLDTLERNSFFQWRRELATLEQDERLVLTPFEKNLEVWRQLWRVLERSDVVVQVCTQAVYWCCMLSLLWVSVLVLSLADHGCLFVCTHAHIHHTNIPTFYCRWWTAATH